MSKLIYCMLLNLIVAASSLHAVIFKTTEIEDVTKEITADTMVLFNIAEVLMDTETSLGTQAWRKYVRSRVDSQLHDKLTLFVFQNVPPKTPEPATANLIKSLQEKGVLVLAFTSRGRSEWYATQMPGIDQITEEMMLKIDLDFSKTKLTYPLTKLNFYFKDYFHSGIIYATNSIEKGRMLSKLMATACYAPSKVVFVDDKADSLESVETAMQELRIPFTGFAYARTVKEHANFDPMVAHIQLDWLISYGKILSDAEALQIKEEMFKDADPEAYFAGILQKWYYINQ